MSQKKRRQKRPSGASGGRGGGVAERGGIGEIKRRGERICQGSFEGGQHGEQAVVDEDEVLQNGSLQRPWRRHDQCDRRFGDSTYSAIFKSGRGIKNWRETLTSQNTIGFQSCPYSGFELEENQQYSKIDAGPASWAAAHVTT
jgi:hypothetical protein